jgi:hypothetical protein
MGHRGIELAAVSSQQAAVNLQVEFFLLPAVSCVLHIPVSPDLSSRFTPCPLLYALGPRVVLLMNLSQSLPGHMSINLSGANVSMPKHHLY